ncbi:hypothetical protein ABIB62_003630 [Mucilaginibacter sp. UYP25]|uniref:hypothetical protein n=1 Tax=unclassified Mucilaginibacter TaxID=2617802 RepID=UPI00339937F8
MQLANIGPDDNNEDLADDLNLKPTDEGNPVEGDWDDEEDEDFDDQTESLNDLHEIQVDDDIGEPDPEDDDHMPNGDEK